jgi:heme-degrading monooxygenase HmoA
MHLILWSFEIAEVNETEFRRVYGPEGEWAQLFRRGLGYLGTELLRDLESPRRYLTIDRWDSAGSFERFKIAFGEEYAALDHRCERLTVTERPLGRFDDPGAG